MLWDKNFIKLHRLQCHARYSINPLEIIFEGRLDNLYITTPAVFNKHENKEERNSVWSKYAETANPHYNYIFYFKVVVTDDLVIINFTAARTWSCDWSTKQVSALD